MSKPQVEELESRLLLNGTSCSSRAAPAQTSAPAAGGAAVVTRSPPLDSGTRHAGPADQGWTGPGGADTARPATVASPGPGGTGSQSPTSGGPEPQGRAAGSVRIDANLPRASGAAAGAPVAGEPVSVAGTPRSQETPAAVVAAEVTPAEFAAGSLAQAANPMPLFLVADLLGALLVPVVAPGAPAAGPPAAAAGEGPGAGPVPGPSVPPSAGHTPIPPEAPPPGNGEPGEGPPPSPQVPGVSSFLPPFDLPGLDRGLRQLLGRLPHRGHGPAGDEEGTALGPWVVACAAAAAAGAITLRQLRRRTGGAAAGPEGES
jgi:hypothetical protein